MWRRGNGLTLNTKHLLLSSGLAETFVLILCYNVDDGVHQGSQTNDCPLCGVMLRKQKLYKNNTTFVRNCNISMCALNLAKLFCFEFLCSNKDGASVLSFGCIFIRKLFETRGFGIRGLFPLQPWKDIVCSLHVCNVILQFQAQSHARPSQLSPTISVL